MINYIILLEFKLIKYRYQLKLNSKINMAMNIHLSVRFLQLKKEQPNYNVEGTKEASEFTVFNRAWTYIKNIDIDNEDHLQAIINMEKKVFYTSLQSAIEYFQIEEEYEKCAHLFNIQEVVRKI